MKRLVTLFFVLAVCGTGAVAQEGAYKTVKDIAYRDAAGDGNIDTMCRLDIYYPVGKTGFSTVVWYHGGGLTGGRREIPEALKDKGLAVVGVEYRLSPTVKVADCVDDAAAAAAWVVKHIASYGGDPGRGFVAGHSGDREREMLGRYEENAYFWRMMRVAGHPDVRICEFDGFDHGNMPQAGHFVAVRYIREMERRMDR